MNEGIGLASIGHLAGRAEVRDKNGNLKSSFTFGGPATVAEAEAVAEANPSIEMKLKLGDDNGSNTDHSGP